MLRIASALAASLLVATPAAADTSCTNGIDSVTGSATAVLACSGDACLSFTNGTAKPTEAKGPGKPTPPRPAIRKDAAGKQQACGGATCKPAGPLLAAAAGKSTFQVAVADDAAFAIVDTDLWDVAADTKVAIAKPPKPPMPDPVPYLAGHVVVATWRNCADDLNCGGEAIATIVDAHGKQIGKPFPDGRLVIVDAHHAAVIGFGHKLTSFDTDTGAQLGTIAVIPNGLLQGISVGKVDDGSVGVAWSGAGSMGWKLALIKTPAGKAPSVGWTRSVPICPP